MNARARILAVISAIGVPWKALGTLFRASCSRRPANSIIATPKPTEVAKAYTMDSARLNLNHLHQGGYHKDKSHRLHEFDMQRDKHIVLEKICHKRRKRNHETYGTGHSHGSAQLVGHAQERTAAEELGQQDIVYEYRRYDDYYIFHSRLLFCRKSSENHYKIAKGKESARGKHKYEDAVSGYELEAEC